MHAKDRYCFDFEHILIQQLQLTTPSLGRLAAAAFEQLGKGNQELRFGTTTIIMDFQPSLCNVHSVVWCGVAWRNETTLVCF
jgi:hypothetical protein